MASELHLTPRDGFRRKLYLSHLGTLMQLDGAIFDGAVLSLQPGPATALLHIKPALQSSTHAYLTLRGDGDATRTKKHLLRCAAPCGFERLPFRGDQAHNHIYRVRLGSARGATVEIRAYPEARSWA